MSYQEVKRIIKDKNSQYEITRSFIKEFEETPYIPRFMITRTYYKYETRRKKIVEHNHRVGKVLNDMFNPRGTIDYHISINHFIEKHQSFLKRDKLDKVLNTITGEYEFDGEKKIVDGGYHIHTLVSAIDELAIENPNRNIRRALPELGIDFIHSSFIEEVGYEDIIADLMDYTLKERCDFIGTSSQSLNITIENPRKSYNGFSGWKGMVAYCCKGMKDADSILEIYDYENNDLTR